MNRSPPGEVGLSGASSTEVHRPLTCAVFLQASLDFHTGEPQTTRSSSLSPGQLDSPVCGVGVALGS